jgi:RNA polymerase sigma factor (sigma-70 family)
MSKERSSGDSVADLVGKLRVGGDSSSTIRRADRVLRRAEPVARATCRAEAGMLPAPRVEELVQDTLEIVWTKLAEFDPDGPPFEAWVRGIALNVSRNARRKQRDVLTEDGVIEATDPAHGVLRVLQRDQRESLVTGAIEAGLQGEEQDVLYHRYMHGLSRDQIADLMGLPDADAVRKILVRARRRLRNELLARLEKLRHSMSLLHSEEG